MNKNIFKSALILTIIGVACGLLIGLTNFLTAPIIKENQIKIARKAYEGFFPELTTIEIKEVDGKYVYEYVKVIKDSETIGHAFRAKGTNPRGLVDIVIAATKEGAIKGIKILSTENTPGYYDQYEGTDGNLIGVNGNTLDDLTGITNISSVTQTGNLLNLMIKEAGEIAHKYVEVTAELNPYESLFGLGAIEVIDEEFVGSEIVTEKTFVYDEDENLLGLTYRGTVTVENTIPGKPVAELTIIVGMSTEGKIKGIYELVNEHTPDRYENYYDSLADLKGKHFAELEIDSISDVTISASILNQIFTAIKEFAVNDFPTDYELIFSEGVSGIVIEDFVGNEIVTEKAHVYDEEENLIGYTYTASITLIDTIPYQPSAELKIMVGVDLDGKIKGILHLVNEHTPHYYDNLADYYNVIKELNEKLIADAEIDVDAEASISGNTINQLLNAIKEVIQNE